MYNQLYKLFKTYIQNRVVKLIYGYARVSTYNQAKDGNSLESQQNTLKSHGATEIYCDSSTGTKIERPQLGLLLAALQKGDTLIVTKLDRIARSLTEGITLINSLIEQQITVHILNIGIMDATPASRLIRNIFFSFAEFERDMIIERCQEGKAIAKQKSGFKEGRPRKFTETQLRHARNLLSEFSYKQTEELTGISKSTLQRAMRKIKVKEDARDDQ